VCIHIVKKTASKTKPQALSVCETIDRYPSTCMEVSTSQHGLQRKVVRREGCSQLGRNKHGVGSCKGDDVVHSLLYNAVVSC